MKEIVGISLVDSPFQIIPTVGLEKSDFVVQLIPRPVSLARVTLSVEIGLFIDVVDCQPPLWKQSVEGFWLAIFDQQIFSLWKSIVFSNLVNARICRSWVGSGR